MPNLYPTTKNDWPYPYRVEEDYDYDLNVHLYVYVDVYVYAYVYVYVHHLYVAVVEIKYEVHFEVPECKFDISSWHWITNRFVWMHSIWIVLL